MTYARFYFCCYRKRKTPKKVLEFYCVLSPDVLCHDWNLLDSGPLLEILFLWKLHQTKVFWRDLKTNWIFICRTCLWFDFPTRIFQGNDTSLSKLANSLQLYFFNFQWGHHWKYLINSKYLNVKNEWEWSLCMYIYISLLFWYSICQYIVYFNKVTNTVIYHSLLHRN